MDTPQPAEAAPIVPIRLTLGAALARRFEQGLRAAAISAVGAAVADMLATLGIPGRPEVDCLPAEAATAARRPLEISANGRLCRYSDELMHLLSSYVRGSVLIRVDEVEAWIAGAEEPALAEWLGLLCRHAVGRHAGVLLGPAQGRAYCAGLAAGVPAGAANPTHLTPILAGVLDLGISIADGATVSSTIAASAVAGDDAPTEALITALRPDHVEIRIERDYLRQLSISDGARGPEMFAFLREGMFDELGLAFPRFHIVPDETLRPGGIDLVINHLPSAPSIGLAPGRILVNDTPDRLQLLGVPADPALNPASYLTSALASDGTKERLDNSGVVTWDQLSYLILVCAARLRARGRCLVDRSLVSQMLAQLGEGSPELAQAAELHLSLDQLTALLRGLVAEQISIRNLRRILELMLEHELLVQRGAPLAERISYVRAGLSDLISYTYARGRSMLATYLLDPAAEQLVTTARAPASTQVEQQLIDAIRAELAHIPPGASWPPITVSEAAYAPLRAMLADDLPRLRVLAYTQLSPDLNLLPVARIALAG